MSSDNRRPQIANDALSKYLDKLVNDVRKGKRDPKMVLRLRRKLRGNR